MTLTNDVALPSPVANLTSADVNLDTQGRDCSLKLKKKKKDCVCVYVCVLYVACVCVSAVAMPNVTVTSPLL